MVENPRVLHIIDHMGLGGAQRIVEGLINHPRNNEWFFYSLKKCSSTHNSLLYRDSSNKYDILSLFELKNIIREKNITILHCHLKKAFLIGYLLKILYYPNIRLIIHEHGKIEDNKYIKFLNFTWNKVDLFIAVSTATQKRLVKYTKIPERNIKIIYNYVDLDYFSPNKLSHLNRKEVRTQFGVGLSDHIIGFAARIVESKGWRELLLAVHKLKNKNIKLLIAGTGPDIDKLHHMIQDLKLENNVKYIGFIDDIRRFYSCIDFFIMPSHWEGLPMAGLEAQACGIPVLASNVEGLNEIIQDMETGILFEKGNFQEIQEKINFLVENYQFRMHLITNGLHSVKEYSLDKYIEKLENLYAELSPI
jgi:glycosyltransferase involved in cell wall biosynthesis